MSRERSLRRYCHFKLESRYYHEAMRMKISGTPSLYIISWAVLIDGITLPSPPPTLPPSPTLPPLPTIPPPPTPLSLPTTPWPCQTYNFNGFNIRNETTETVRSFSYIIKSTWYIRRQSGRWCCDRWRCWGVLMLSGSQYDWDTRCSHKLSLKPTLNIF